MTNLLAIGFPNIGLPELILLGLLGLVLFGRRLPEVGRSLGRSIVQFKKGLSDVDHEIESSSKPDTRSLPSGDARKAEATPKDSAT